MLDPGHKLMWAWHVLMLMSCTYAFASVISLNLYHSVQQNYDVWHSALMVPDIVLSLAIVANAVVEVNTGFYDAQSAIVRDRSRIVQRYVSTWLALDFIALLPMRYFTTHALTAIILGHFRILWVVRMPYFLQTPRGSSINSVFINFHFIVVPFVRNALYFLCLVHFFAIVAHRTMDAADTYSASVYLIMYLFAGTGYGDKAPTSDSQRLFLIVLCVFAMLINGVVIGSIVSFLASSDVEAMRRNRLVETLAVLQFFDVPVPLQEEVLQFQNHVMKKDIQAAFGHIIDHLPDEMKTGLTLQFRITLIKCIRLFSTAHFSTQVALAQVLEPSVSCPEEYIVLAGEEGDTMFFINYGFVDVLTREGLYLETLSVNRCFGMEAVFEPFTSVYHKSVQSAPLMPPTALPDGHGGESPATEYLHKMQGGNYDEGKYKWSAKTLTYIEVMALSMRAFATIVLDFPRFRLQVEEAVTSGEGVPIYQAPMMPARDELGDQAMVHLTVANIESHDAEAGSSRGSDSPREFNFELPPMPPTLATRQAARAELKTLEDTLQKELATFNALMVEFADLAGLDSVPVENSSGSGSRTQSVADLRRRRSSASMPPPAPK